MSEGALKGRDFRWMIIDELESLKGLPIIEDIVIIPNGSRISPAHGFTVGDEVSFPLGPVRKPHKMVVTSVDEYSMTVTSLSPPSLIPEEVRPNRGPQGDIETWKRRGRRGKR